MYIVLLGFYQEYRYEVKNMKIEKDYLLKQIILNYLFLKII